MSNFRYFCVKHERVHLILEITSHFVSAWKRESENLTLLENLEFVSKTESGYKETLSQLIEKLGDLNRFDAFSCSYFGQAFSVVPSSLFAASTPEALLQFTVQRTLTKSDVEYNRLPEWNAVIIYELPMWVKSVLILKAPRIVIQHEMTHLLRHLTTGSMVPLRSHVVIHEDQFSLVIRKDGAIVHTSIQDYQNEADVVYHVANAFTQLNISTKNELFIHGTVAKSESKFATIVAQMKRMNLFEQTKFEIQPTHHLQFQKLCV